MVFEEALNKSTKLRRTIWGDSDFIVFSEKGLEKWDNKKFSWIHNIKLSLDDILAKDWEPVEI